jgi:hypothetical protein
MNINERGHTRGGQVLQRTIKIAALRGGFSFAKLVKANLSESTDVRTSAIERWLFFFLPQESQVPRLKASRWGAFFRENSPSTAAAQGP